MERLTRRKWDEKEMKIVCVHRFRERLLDRGQQGLQHPGLVVGGVVVDGRFGRQLVADRVEEAVGDLLNRVGQRLDQLRGRRRLDQRLLFQRFLLLDIEFWFLFFVFFRPRRSVGIWLVQVQQSRYMFQVVRSEH